MEDRRRSAEIREMASQKVAVEFIKRYVVDGTDLETAKNLFVELTEWLSAQVVAAGDRAETPPKPADPETPIPTPPNGSEAARDGLTAVQVDRMVTLLGEVDPELLKLKFFEMDLPFTVGAVDMEAMLKEAAETMNVTQGKAMVAWMKEQRV